MRSLLLASSRQAWGSGLHHRRFLRAVAALTALIFVAALLASVARAAPLADDQVIVPKRPAANEPAAGAPGLSGAFTTVAVLALAGAGAWLLWRGRRTGGFTAGRRAAQQLAVEETRSLGNRQYLVVATYQEKKFLIGVCPGRIDLLAPLHETNAADLEKTRA